MVKYEKYQFFCRSKGFDIKWVDDTHALGIFSSHISGELVIKWVMAFEDCVFESRKHKNFPAFPALTCLSLPPTQALGNNFA